LAGSDAAKIQTFSLYSAIFTKKELKKRGRVVDKGYNFFGPPLID
jgi:hypothetical protein